MNSDRWKQIEALYNSALTVDAAAREDFLASACAGDEMLRREVLSLLSSAERADSFLEEPALGLGLTLLGERGESFAGKTLGRYKLLELLGRGGMGEVYLAHDPRLNRRVALKLLPAELGDDPERVRRFEREAHSASVISHPNVAHIYEIGEEQGQRFITMEHVRGRTLREVMKPGPLGARQALDIAAEVALALQAAHESGVVHRDIKPENVMLRDDGYVKVLDFGLAKLVEVGLTGADSEAAPVSTLHTQPELLMGTSDYMSPEQLRRQPPDARTDLWSLGVVLYEMLAGRRPFRGRETSELVVDILEREPEPLSALRPELPPALNDVVSKALMKRPEDRYQSAQSFAADLRRLKQTVVDRDDDAHEAVESERGWQSSSAPQDEQSDATPAESSRPYGLIGRMSDFTPGALVSKRVPFLAGRWGVIRWLLLFSVLGAGAVIGITQWRRPAMRERAINLRFERLNLSGGISEITLSSDGKYVASVVSEGGKSTIHIKELATASDLRVAPPSEEGYSGLSFSPDGTYLYYLENHAETGTLYRVSKLGGGQRKILENVNTSVTFSPDGSRIAFVRSNAALHTPDLMVASADGTGERLLSRRAPPDADFFLSDMKQAGPVWSPDGKVLACPTRTRARGRPEINLETLDAESGAGRRLNHTPWNDISRVVWLADGSGVVVSASEAPGTSSQLHLLAYPGGEARRVTNDPNNYVSINGARDSGLFLTLNIEESSSVWQIAVEEGAQPSTVGVEQRKGVSEVRWGDGGGTVYTVGDGSHTNVWVQDGTVVRQLTFEADNFSPAFSRDRRHVVYGSTRAGTTNLWRVNADGTQPLRLTTGAYEDQPSLTPDGRWVIYRTGNAVKKVSIDGGEAVKVFDGSVLYPALSPDGRLLAYFTNDKPDSKTWVVEIYDLGASARLKRFGLPEATNPFNSLRWTPDGKALAFVSNADGASNVWLQPFDGGEPSRLTSFEDAEILSFDFSADGRRLLCVRNTKAYVPVLVRLF